MPNIKAVFLLTKRKKELWKKHLLYIYKRETAFCSKILPFFYLIRQRKKERNCPVYGKIVAFNGF